MKRTIFYAGLLKSQNITTRARSEVQLNTLKSFEEEFDIKVVTADEASGRKINDFMLELAHGDTRGAFVVDLTEPCTEAGFLLAKGDMDLAAPTLALYQSENARYMGKPEGYPISSIIADTHRSLRFGEYRTHARLNRIVGTFLDNLDEMEAKLRKIPMPLPKG